MSSNPISSLPSRKSFAQVAAEAHVSKMPKTPIIPVIPLIPTVTSQPLVPPSKLKSPQPVADVQGLEKARDTKANGGSMDQLNVLLKAVALQENESHSSSDASFRKECSDTKSVASRTTLTLDEKESVQPDDSASMQAAPEDDLLSVSGSGIAVSSRESDPNARAFREQLQEIDQTASAGPVPQGMPVCAGISLAGLNSVGNSFSMPLAVLNAPNMAMASSMIPTQPRISLPELVVPPDEKLLEALASPKDRLFVLKIEQDMIDFVKDSKEEFLQLPQTNAFYRMLSHKLADYYLLGHLVDESLTSVRIHRTPHCRLPSPLIGFDIHTAGSTPPPTVAARKIMRRGVAEGRGQHRRNTITPNGQLSENASGSDDDTKMSDKDKAALTREERESRYNEARARIFKDFKEPSEENSEPSEQKDNDISRSSSASGARKGKKNRRPKDDGFEARSAYSAYGGLPYSTLGYSQPMMTAPSVDNGSVYTVPAQYAVPNSGFDSSYMTNFGGQQYMQPQQVNAQAQLLGQPYQTGFVSPQNSANYGSYSNLYTGNPSTGYQSWPPANAQSQVTPTPSNPHLAGYDMNYQQQTENGWPQSGYGGTYAPSYQDNVNSQAAQSQAAQPFQFSGSVYNGNQYNGGQHFEAQMAHSQMFNPQSQTFVPKPSNNPYQQAQQDSSANMQGNGMRARSYMPIQRQTSNTSQYSQMSGYNSPHYPQQTSAGSRPHGQISSTPGLQTSRQQQPNQSTIAKWGTPATLPAKPPPPATSLPHQISKDSQQPLPPHPFLGLSRAPANASR